ncbi:hypothetical protein [Acinetobacter pittii]|uniref:hypothetical protein n=1 Tax=Acinetobacter pittii TaxID=48296 RepID=UPI001D18122F|nr:hypothetical protein [Acinetobacter pittii]
MTEFQKNLNEIRQLQTELNHLGSCITKGLSTEQIAHLDERFFWLLKRLHSLKTDSIIRLYS